MQTLIVDTCDDGCKRRCTRGCATDQTWPATPNDRNAVADCGEVRITSAGTVIDSSIGTKAAVVDAEIARIRWLVLKEILLHGKELICRLSVDIRETTTRGESGRGNFLVVVHVGAGWKERRAQCRKIGAGCRKARSKDISIFTQASIGTRVTFRALDAIVAGGIDDRDTLQSEFRDLETPVLISIHGVGYVLDFIDV